MARHARITLEFSGWRVPFASCGPQDTGSGSTTSYEGMEEIEGPATSPDRDLGLARREEHGFKRLDVRVGVPTEKVRVRRPASEAPRY